MTKWLKWKLNNIKTVEKENIREKTVFPENVNNKLRELIDLTKIDEIKWNSWNLPWQSQMYSCIHKNYTFEMYIKYESIHFNVYLKDDGIISGKSILHLSCYMHEVNNLFELWDAAYEQGKRCKQKQVDEFLEL